ncbi:MAG TPA: hypothetical protein DEA47_00740 [Peptococcaceae bacterium]|nr:hypothetical protein [Peptococcaceae bacterium]
MAIMGTSRPVTRGTPASRPMVMAETPAPRPNPPENSAPAQVFAAGERAHGSQHGNGKDEVAGTVEKRRDGPVANRRFLGPVEVQVVCQGRRAGHDSPHA